MFRYNIDVATEDLISGWAFYEGSREAVTVEVILEGNTIRSERTSVVRPDVLDTAPDSSQLSGFTMKFSDRSETTQNFVERTIRLIYKDKYLEIDKTNFLSTPTASLSHISRTGVKRFLNAPSSTPSGLPQSISDGIHSIEPESTDQASMVETLLNLSRSSFRSDLPEVISYLRYLRSIHDHFSFIEKYFPAKNEKKSPSDKDWVAKANSIPEMLGIANYLYVLKSYGVSGIFAEFGCFKGYSTSMLSYACELLGIDMHVFDSFEGLPPSESEYYKAGEFAGGFDEVVNNVKSFGSRNSVTFHRGFFSKSLRDWHLGPIMCIWMDVDLESSANDLLTVASNLDIRSAIFSHECAPENFVDGKIVSPTGADYVIPPIVKHFGPENVTGQHISGFTGVFQRHNAIPVLSSSALMRLMAGI